MNADNSNSPGARNSVSAPTPPSPPQDAATPEDALKQELERAERLDEYIRNSAPATDEDLRREVARLTAELATERSTNAALKKVVEEVRAHLVKEFKKLPDGLLEAVKEVTFRVALVEIARDDLRDKTVPALKSLLASAEGALERIAYHGRGAHPTVTTTFDVPSFAQGVLTKLRQQGKGEAS